MKTLNFNKNSWHYRLVRWLKLYQAPYQKDIWGDGSEFRSYGDSGDICTYSKKVVLALFLLFLSAFGISFVLYILIHTLFGIYFSLLTGQWLFSEPGTFGVIISGIAIVFVSIFMLAKTIHDYSEKNSYKPRVQKPDSFIKHAYKAWKDKYCLPINFE